MANPFDQFDAGPAPLPAARSGNPFDRFDAGSGSGHADPGALHIRVGGRPSPEPETTFDDRHGSGPMASETDASTPLGVGLRSRADEMLVGKPSTENAIDAGLFHFADAFGLNLPRNMMAGAEALRSGKGFDESYRYVRDVEDALARQYPKTALSGTIGGIVGGAMALPAFKAAEGANLGARFAANAGTGAVYGGIADGLDEKTLLAVGRGAGIGGLAGGVGGVLIEKAAQVVMGLFRKGVPFRGTDGRMTESAANALREAGIDPAQITPGLEQQIVSAFTAKGPSPAAAREALAAEQGITLSRGQATLDPASVRAEGMALSGRSGGRAQEIGQGFEARQAAEIEAARGRLQATAARGGPPIDNPSAAFEAAADRARMAGDAGARRIGAAQQAQDDALRAVQGPNPVDALDGAAAAVQGARDAAERSRGAYRQAYGEVAEIPGSFAPGTLDDAGARVRLSLGPEVPIDDRLTPAAHAALTDLDNLPRILGLPPGEGPTLQQVEQVRKRLVSYYGSTTQNPTDKRALGRVIDGLDQHVEDALSRGQFGDRIPARRAAGDAPPDPMSTIEPPIGDTGPADAMRKARGLFREHKQAFAPRAPGDVAGQRLQKIVDRDASPNDAVSMLFGTTTGRVSSGQLQTLDRLRSAVGDGSETWQAVQQAIVGRYIGGDGRGLGQRLDYLLRGEGRDLATRFLSPEQRGGLGQLRAAVAATERAHEPPPQWVRSLERHGFDPNAIASSLFGSGVPGARVGAMAEARAAKAFLGEASPEWSGLRQAAVQMLTEPTMKAGRIVERVRAFTDGPGSGVAREMFSPEELGQFRRFAAALNTTIRPDGTMKPGSEAAAGMVAKALDVLAGMVAFKVGGPGAAGAAYGAKAGQRAVFGGMGAANARRSFEGGAPRVRVLAPALPTDRLAVGAGLAAGGN